MLELCKSYVIKEGHMKRVVPVFLAYGVLIMLTATYCALVWYGGNLFVLLVDYPRESLPLISRLCAPLPFSIPIGLGMIHWQLPAVLLLVFCIVYGYRNYGLEDLRGYGLLIALHSSWILFSLCFNCFGFVRPLLVVGQMVK